MESLEVLTHRKMSNNKKKSSDKSNSTQTKDNKWMENCHVCVWSYVCGCQTSILRRLLMTTARKSYLSEQTLALSHTGLILTELGLIGFVPASMLVNHHCSEFLWDFGWKLLDAGVPKCGPINLGVSSPSSKRECCSAHHDEADVGSDTLLCCGSALYVLL